MSMTARTSKDPDIQLHGLPVSTCAAGLRRIGRVDFDEWSASFFRFTGQLLKEGRPGGICNAFGKTMGMHHPVDMYVFYRNQAIAIDDFPAFLMGEISTPERNPFMDTRYRLAMLAPLRRTLSQSGVCALHRFQCLLFFPEKARVRDFRSIREGGEGFESNINTDLSRHITKGV